MTNLGGTGEGGRWAILSGSEKGEIRWLPLIPFGKDVLKHLSPKTAIPQNLKVQAEHPSCLDMGCSVFDASLCFGGFKGKPQGTPNLLFCVISIFIFYFLFYFIFFWRGLSFFWPKKTRPPTCNTRLMVLPNQSHPSGRSKQLTLIIRVCLF